MKFSNAVLMASVSMLGVMSPAISHAQTADEASASSEAGEIIVTARKRSERLIDVPETIQAVSAETLQRAGISNINDLGRLTPNTVLNRRQDNEPNVVIRGIGSFGNTQGIGFYIDDVQNFTDQSPNMGDVERVEILKGPQGTLYGGSNVGGAVKYVMKKPGDAFGVEGNIEVGGYDTFNVFGAVNAPLSSDGSFAVRLSGYHNRFGGFIRNSFLNENPDKSRETGFRAALQWKPSDVLSFNLAYRHNELDNGGNVYIHTDNVDDVKYVADFDQHIANNRTVDGVTFQADFTPGDVILTSITSYARRKNKFLWDLDYSSADAVGATEGKRKVGHIYTQELRLASDNGDALDWIVGAYAAKIENRNPTNSADLFLGIDHPAYGVLGGVAPDPVPLTDFNDADVRERQYAAFATANYDMGQFKLGGGVRLNRYEYKAKRFDPNTGDPLALINNDTKVLFKLSAGYEISDSNMFYANVGRGMEPGRANVIGDFTDTYKPETAMNYELGFKGRTADRKLSYEVAAFYITYNGRQQEVQVNDPIRGVIELITNVGDTRTYGAEASFTYRPMSDLTLSAGAGWLNSEWKNGAIVGPDLVDPTMTAVYPLKGLDVPNSPKFSANASLDWRKPVDDVVEFGLRVDWAHAGNFYWDLRNRAKQSAYDIVNMAVSLGGLDGKWTATLRVENLFKEKYFNELVYAFYDEPDANGNCAGCSLGTPGTPRRAMASFRFNF